MQHTREVQFYFFRNIKLTNFMMKAGLKANLLPHEKYYTCIYERICQYNNNNELTSILWEVKIKKKANTKLHREVI